MRRGLRLFCLAPVAWATPAAAQLAGTLDVGAGTYRPERSIPGGIASIAPMVRYRSGALELDGSGVYSDAPAGRWNFQGTGAAFLRTPHARPLQLEASGQAEWTSHYRVRGTTTFIGGLRAYLNPGAGTRLWIGRQMGQASALGTRRPLRRSELGTSARIGTLHLGFLLSNTSFDRSLMGGIDVDSPRDTLGTLPEPSGRDSSRLERLALTDAVISGQWRIRSLDIDAMIGRRFSRGTPQLTIWGLSAARSVTPTLALVAAAGRASADPVTSVPGARYLAIGLRLKVGSQIAPSLPAPGAPTTTARFRIGPAVAAGREVVVRVPEARAVELAGDFTDWKPVPLQPWGKDAWRALLPIAPGVRRLAIRIDGGAWRAPPGTRPITSEFGGEVTEILVE